MAKKIGPASQFQWEKRALEARRMAETMKHPTRKREMLLIASAYDKLAEHTREVSLLRRQHWIHFLPASTEEWLSVRGRPRS